MLFSIREGEALQLSIGNAIQNHLKMSLSAFQANLEFLLDSRRYVNNVVRKQAKEQRQGITGGQRTKNIGVADN